MRNLIWIFLLVLSACSPSSMEDFQWEGESLSRGLLSELQEIKSREDLNKCAPALAKRFDQLVDLMIEARKFQQKNPEQTTTEPLLRAYLTSEKLCSELQRIYDLEGGRSAIEKMQREALLRLDAFERSLAKKGELKSK